MEYVEMKGKSSDHEQTMGTTQALLGALIISMAVGLIIAAWAAGISVYSAVALTALALLCLGLTAPKMAMNFIEIER